jgi:hypothetical protein
MEDVGSCEVDFNGCLFLVGNLSCVLVLFLIVSHRLVYTGRLERERLTCCMSQSG